MNSSTYEGDAGRLKDGTLSILTLVEGLQAHITSEDGTLRSQGVKHLAQVIEACPQGLRSHEDIAVLTAFFSDKLTDRACISAALTGCLALLAAEQVTNVQHLMAPQQDTQMKAIVDALFKDVPVQALSQANRQASLQLLLKVIKEHGGELLSQGLDLIQGTVIMVDGERDPRCLLLVFEIVQALVHLYSTSTADMHRVALGSKCEDLCDVLACYFPITFRLQPNSPHGITREDLAAALEAAMRCTPLFAPYLVPLLLEKLSSSLWQAKVDALSALATCIKAWGSAAKPYLSRLWPSLRNELTDAAEPAPGEADVAKAAADCLRRCIAALERPSQHGSTHTGEWSLLTEALSSEAVADIPQWLLESSSGEATSLATQVATAAIILKAVASASVFASRQVCRRYMTPLLSIVNAEEATPAALAMSVILAILQGAQASVNGKSASVAAEEVGSAHDQGPLLDWGPRLLQAELAEGRCSSVKGSWSNATEQQMELLRVQVIACLATFPAGNCTSPLGSRDHAEAIKFLLTHASSPRAAKPVLSAVAIKAIAEAIGAGHEQAVAAVLPALLDASSRLAPDGSTWAGQPAVNCTVAICRASATLRAENLRSWLEKFLTSETGRRLLTAHLAALADNILPACTRPFAGAEAEAASNVAQTAMTALDALALSCSREAMESILPVCASAVQVATAGCDVRMQEAIADCAGSILAQAASKSAGAEQEVEGMAATSSGSAACIVACAALVGLRPGVREQHALSLLRAVLCNALTASWDEHARVAAAASASLLLKWPTGSGPLSIDAAVGVALDEIVLPRLQLQLKGDSQSVRLRAIELLGWLAKGLAMRGHPRASKPIDTALAYLEAASLDMATAQEKAAASAEQDDSCKVVTATSEGMEGTAAGDAGSRPEEEDALEGWDDAFDAKEARTMAGVFMTVLSEGLGIARLDDSTHAWGRVLWKQKVFTGALNGLQEKLQEGVDFLGSPPAPLLLGLARLVEGAPRDVLKGALPKLLPWLLDALQALSKGLLVDSSALAAILSSIADTLADKAGRKALEEHISQLVPALLANSAYSEDSGVRAAALSCLAATMQLPYSLLHPHRPAVLRALVAAVDDPKRLVRTQAARCRQAWLP